MPSHASRTKATSIQKTTLWMLAAASAHLNNGSLHDRDDDRMKRHEEAEAAVKALQHTAPPIALKWLEQPYLYSPGTLGTKIASEPYLQNCKWWRPCTSYALVRQVIKIRELSHHGGSSHTDNPVVQLTKNHTGCAPCAMVCKGCSAHGQHAGPQLVDCSTMAGPVWRKICQNRFVGF